MSKTIYRAAIAAEMYSDFNKVVDALLDRSDVDSQPWRLIASRRLLDIAHVHNGNTAKVLRPLTEIVDGVALVNGHEPALTNVLQVLSTGGRVVAEALSDVTAGNLVKLNDFFVNAAAVMLNAVSNLCDDTWRRVEVKFGGVNAADILVVDKRATSWRASVELLQKISTVVARTASMSIAYNHSQQHARSNLREVVDIFADDFAKIDFAEVPPDDLARAGFVCFNQDRWCVPLHLLEFFPDGTEFVSINGQRCVKGVDHIDTDVRFGCIAYTIVGPALVNG